MRKIFSLLKFSDHAERKIGILFFLYVLQAILLVAQPEVLNRSVSAIEERQLQGLWGAMILAGVVLVGNLAVDLFLKLRRRQFENATLLSVQTDLLGRVVHFNRARFQEADHSAYLTGIVNYAESTVSSGINWLFSTFSSITTLIVCVLYMGYLSVPLTAIVVSFNLLLRLVLTKVEKQIKKNVAACNQVLKRNNGFLVELLENMLSVRVNHKESYFDQRFSRNETDTYHSRVRSYVWNSGQSEFVWCTLKFAEYVLVYGIGGILLYYGLINFGLFLAYPIAMDYFVKAINTFLYALVDKNTALSTAASMEWLYETRGMEEGEMGMEPAAAEMVAVEPAAGERTTVGAKSEAKLAAMSRGAIRFDHVSFSYKGKDGEKKEILKDVSFAIERGEKVLLQGQNGEGKSTLLYLLSGQYRPDSGEIFYGGIPTRPFAIDELIKQYGLIAQENSLLTCSVDQNIALRKEPEEQRCRLLLQKLRMEYAYDSKLALLSQGEKQRVNVARAFYKKAEGDIFLLGDEILSNMDPENARNVLHLIEEEFWEETVILVAHGETGFVWDKRITIENGRVLVEKRGGR